MTDDMELDAWARNLLAELGVDASIEVDEILDLAAGAAHSVKRPAAPVTTFIAGLAAGLAGGTQPDIAAAIGTSTTLCESKQIDSDVNDPER